VVARAFSSAEIPFAKEPAGLCRTDFDPVERWQACCMGRDSYVYNGSFPHRLRNRSYEQNDQVQRSGISVHVANCGRDLGPRPLNDDAHLLLTDLGRRISAESGDLRWISFLFQKSSVVVQRFNAMLLHNSFVKDHQPELVPFHSSFLYFLLFFDQPAACGFNFSKEFYDNNN